jgi:hypothetical protein
MDAIQQRKHLATLIEIYLNTLNEKEMRAYVIAKEHLGSSFDLSKSVGFIQWRKDFEK